MPQFRHTFSHLDSDTDHAARQGGDFDAALNIALEPGYVAVQRGNVPVPYVLPDGNTRSLGAIEDGATGTAICFLCNSAGAHQLVRYDPRGNAGAGSLTLVLEWAGLNLADDLVLQGAVLDGLLVYLGADGSLRCVSLTRAESGYYTPAVLAADPFCLHLVKVPPTTSAPVAARLAGTGADPREQLQIIQRKAYQFACRWNYLDGEQTVLSPYSNWLDILEDPAATGLNTITVALPPAPTGVSEVEVLVREPDSEGWQVADTLKRSASGLPTTYNFYGVTSGGAVTPAEATRLFEAEWPGKAFCVARSRPFKADLLEGYPTPEPAFTAVVSTDTPDSSNVDLYILTIEDTQPSDQYPGESQVVTYFYYYYALSGTYPDPVSTWRQVTPFQRNGAQAFAQGSNTLSFQEAFVDPKPGIQNETHREVQDMGTTAIYEAPDAVDQYTFHENSTYRVGVQFYDALGKPYGVGTAKSVPVPARPKGNTLTRSIRATLTTTDPVALNLEIPEGAYSYHFLVGRNDRTTYFLQGQAADCFGYLGHTTTVNSDNVRLEGEKLVDVIHEAHQKVWVDIGNFPAAGLGYVWQPGSGDVLRFLNEGKEFVITNQVGDYLEVQWSGHPDQSIDSTGQTVARIEIYSPNTTPSPIFYERGPRLAVTRTIVDGQEQRGYSQASVLLEGDCFLVSLRFPQLDKGKDKNNDDNYQPPNIKSWLPGSSDWLVQVESMVPPHRLVPATTISTTIYEKREKGGFFSNLFSNPLNILIPAIGIYSSLDYLLSDAPKTPENTTTTLINPGRTAANFVWLDMSYGGRPGAQVPTRLQQVRREKTLRFGGVKVGGTLLNGLSRWEALSQYDELPQEQGAVVRLSVADQTQAEGSILLANQERGDESLSLGQSTIKTDDGQSLLAISRQVIGGGNSLRGGYGCTDPATVVPYAGRVYSFCARRAELLRYDRNGLTPLAAEYKAGQRLGAVAKQYAGGRVSGCYHPKRERQEYWLTFHPVAHLPGCTLVFSERSKAWADAVSAHPEAGLAFDAELLSWQNGTLWRHTPDAPAATFYGAYTAPALTFTVLQRGGVAVQFKDVAVESPSLWLPTALSIDTGLSSLTRSAWFTYREGVHRAGLRRASNTPGFPTINHALDNGKTLVGSQASITLTPPLDAAPLTACSISMTPRTGQGMGVQ